MNNAIQVSTLINDDPHAVDNVELAHKTLYKLFSR